MNDDDEISTIPPTNTNTNTNTKKVPPTTTKERTQNLFQNSEILAPMVRASTTPLRILALHYGADLVFTEEIVDRSITTQTERIVNTELNTIDYVRKLESFSPKVQRRMMANGGGVGGCDLPVVLRISPREERGRLIYQMGTGEAHLAMEAAERVYQDIDGIDLNMGCPKKFSISGGMGAALLKDLPRARDILSTLRRNLPEKMGEDGGGGGIPLSCKIRMLEDVKGTVDFVLGLVQAGANAITIHGREAGDEATKCAKWDRLVEVVKVLKSTAAMDGVPIIINGDLYTRNDMINLKQRSGADGIMLARPALYNTSIFRKPSHPPSNNNNNNNYLNHHHDQTQTQSQSPEEETRYGYDSPLLLSKTTVVKDYVTYANTYRTHHKNVKYVICEMMNNRRTPSTLAHCMPQVYPGTQSIDKVCKCKSMEDMCRLWDVSMSTVASPSSTVGSGEVDGSISATGGRRRQERDFSVEKCGSRSINYSTSDTVHRYDDRYFLDPEGLQKVRLQQEEQEKEEEQKRHHRTRGNGNCSTTTILEEKKETSSVGVCKEDGGRGNDVIETKAKRAKLGME